MEQFTYQFGLDDPEDERLDKWISEALEGLSRSFIQKCIKEDKVLVNGTPQKASYRLKTDDEIVFSIPEAAQPDITPEDIPLSILYEDDDLLVIDKPKNMVVHPAPGHYSGTIVNAVMYHCQNDLSGIGGVMRPGIVHRIDKDTTGSIIICKNDKAHLSIAAQLKEHSITRKYRASTLRSAGIPRTASAWRSITKTASQLSLTTGFYSVSKTIPISNVSWRQDAHTRSAST